MKDFAAQGLKAALKEALKQRQLRYEDLAEELDCSVPTIKRILGSEELTLTRLLQICEVLDMSLADLEAMTQKEKSVPSEYTEAQATFLARNPSHFAFLMKLYSGMTPRQIAQKHGLSARSTDRYLVALERQELIRVTGAQKVKVTHKQVPNLGRGELAERYFRDLIQRGADFFKQRIAESLATKADTSVSQGFTIHTGKISRETYIEWSREQQRRLAELTRISNFEEKTRPESELMTVVVVDGRGLVENDYAGLARLENAFGEIEEL